MSKDGINFEDSDIEEIDLSNLREKLKVHKEKIEGDLNNLNSTKGIFEKFSSLVRDVSKFYFCVELIYKEIEVINNILKSNKDLGEEHVQFIVQKFYKMKEHIEDTFDNVINDNGPEIYNKEH